jgi:subtilisin family serine protease
MKRAAFATLLLAIPFAAFAAPPPTQSVIVMTRQGTVLAAKTFTSIFDPNISDDERDLRVLSGIHGFAANLSDGEIAALKASGTVTSIEPDFERHAFADTIQAGQQATPYGIANVNAPAVWPVTRGKSLSNGPAIHVAIIDTGIDYRHSELAAAFKGGFNFVARTADPLDDAGHGTHVAGTIAAANDGAGVVGIASDVDLYALKVLSACGSGKTSDIIQAVQWVVDKKKEIGGNWIVNLSLGSSNSSIAEQTEFQTASDSGILVFAASGNGYDSTSPSLVIAFPAGYPTVISVGAVDVDNKITDFSQRGPDLKIVAPGLDVLSTLVDGLVKPAGAGLVARFAEGSDADFNTICLSNGPVTAQTVFAGTGLPSDYPAGATGKIALVNRGGTDPGNVVDQTFTFLAKAKYAKAAGASGVIVMNIIDAATNAPRAFIRPGFNPITQTDVAKLVPLALVSIEDGAALKAAAGSSVTMTFNSTGFSDTFDTLSGTSMSCPHAVGTAALVWAVSPNSTASNVATALEQTAKDLGTPGKDNTFGFGLVDAFAAAKQLNPAAFAPGPVIGPVTGRMAGRRGH